MDKINEVRPDYSLVDGDNSNSFAWMVLDALGLLDEFDYAMDKRARKGYWKPWAPGWGPITAGGARIDW